MTSVQINNITIPLHFDDRYYIADCCECDTEFATRTVDEMREAILAHACNRLV